MLCSVVAHRSRYIILKQSRVRSALFVWTASASAEHVRSREADSRRGDEKQTLSRPCRNPAIFHYLLVSCSCFSGQSPQSPGSLMRGSTHPGTGCQGSGCQKEPGWMQRTIRWHICAISPTSASCSSLSALFLLRQPENGTHLLNLEISGALWDIKGSFQIKASLVTGK